MRNEKEVLEEIISWGVEDENIRVALLTGSRTDPNSTTDILSDYDIEIVVKNTEIYLEEKWLSRFGDVMVVMKIDQEFSLRLVLY